MGLIGFFFGGSRKGGVRVGDPVPYLQGLDENGQNVSLREEAASGPLLVYFYPKADTPACTAQACSLRDAFDEIHQKGCRVLGVSSDGVAQQKSFREKHRLPFRLVADEEGVWARAFGVPTLIGIPARQSFLIKEERVAWIDRSAAAARQAETLLRILKN